MSTIVPRSPLQATILQLASYEHNCFDFAARFLVMSNKLGESPEAWAVAAAADRLIAALISYGRLISIGEEYFDVPCFDSFTPYFSLNWTRHGYSAFCSGCPNREWHCTESAFSSKCCRFRLANAAEHIATQSNKLIHQILTGGTSNVL